MAYQSDFYPLQPDRNGGDCQAEQKSGDQGPPKRG
jgi:hypothetical protein